MIKTYASKKAAIRYALATWGPQWAGVARYLEITLPDAEMLYAIQLREPEPEEKLERLAQWNAREAQAARSGEESIVRRIHAICEILSAHAAKAGLRITRKEILEECQRQGLRRSTSATQYAIWRKQHNHPLLPVEADSKKAH